MNTSRSNSAGASTGRSQGSDRPRERETPAGDEWVEEAAVRPRESFADHLRAVRLQLAGKQIVLSRAIGCTDAAVSLWESGARLPTPRSLGRILAAIAEGGASTAHILALRSAWRDAYARRSVLWGTLGTEKARRSEAAALKFAVASNESQRERVFVAGACALLQRDTDDPETLEVLDLASSTDEGDDRF